MAAQAQLPQRSGARPRTTSTFPHSQLDQQPTDTRHIEAVFAEAATWPTVREQPSTISVQGSRALVVEPDAETGPAEAFMVGREFCHVHAQGDLSLHATLPVSLAEAAEHAGWAESHFLVRTGQAPPTVLLLYAPRDEAEGDVILSLVRASYEFATGAAAQTMAVPTPSRPYRLFGTTSQEES